MVAQSGIITAMCNRYSVDITPVTHVISQGCNIHAHHIPVGTVILHPVPYTIVPGPGRGARGAAGSRRLGALGSKALNTLGIKPAQVCDNLTLDAAVGFGCIGLVLLPAIAMVYGLLAGPG